MDILLDSFFEATASGHGGNHRSAQILELIERSGVSVKRFDRQLLSTARDRYVAGIRSILNPQTIRFVRRHQIQIKPSLENIAFCGFQRQLYDRVLRQHSGTRILLWEATKNYVAPYVAAENHYKTIALPHNLESLVPAQAALFEGLETEIQALKKADVVFCIAREEEWLLRTQGVNAYYLPYYPPSAIVQQLQQVRQSRSPGARFLMLGNAHNPPTQQGMIEQLDGLKQIRSTLEFQVDIVGYGTETLKPYCDHPDFVVHGGVEPEALHQLLVQTKAALVHQKPTSGALTRIPELLIAGVPVIANSNACRSSDYCGVYRYDDWLELTDYLARSLETPPLLAPPIAAQKRFISFLQA